MLQTQTISNIRNKCLAVVLNRHSFLSRNASRYIVHKALVTLFRNRAEIDSYRAHMSNPQSRVLETTHTLEHIFSCCFSVSNFVYDTCFLDSLNSERWGRAACANSLALHNMSREGYLAFLNQTSCFCHVSSSCHQMSRRDQCTWV